MHPIAAQHLDLLHRLGIDPTLGRDELIRQLTVKWREMVRQADEPVVVDGRTEVR